MTSPVPLLTAILALAATGTPAAFAAPAAAETTLSHSPDTSLFADALFTKLSPGVNAARVAGMKSPVLKALAGSLLDGTHASWRLAIAEPYPPLKTLSKTLKIGGYNQYENPVGLRFTAGEEIVVMVGDTGGETLSLRIHSFMNKPRGESHPLSPGENRITVKGDGNGYLEYFTPNAAKARPVPVHFVAGGKVVGFFDRDKNTDADWKKMLASPDADYLDIRGRHVQLAYPVETLRKYCPERGLELITKYDNLMDAEQTLMGLTKYNRRPKNHIFGRAIWWSFMYADGQGAAFNNNTLKQLADPDHVYKSSWAISHEFGHVNQVRPGMKWQGTTETTVNIYSTWNNYLFNPSEMRLEHERCNAGDGLGGVAGGRFNAFLNSAIVSRELWQCQRGPDKMTGYENGGDHFVRVTPFWQLQMYFGVLKYGNPDFYPDVFEIVRKTDEAGLSNGRLQLNFMKNACDVSKQDLTDYFRTVGMLQPIDRPIEDYGKGRVTITEAECAELAAYAKRYPKPLSPVIHYLSADSLPAFKGKLPVSGAFEKGVSTPAKPKNARLIAHEVWKNAAVFETYSGDKLIHVTKTGTGTKDNTSTLVPFPEGATRVEAVAWNGARTLVLGRR